jgi:hypothetical protein
VRRYRRDGDLIIAMNMVFQYIYGGPTDYWLWSGGPGTWDAWEQTPDGWKTHEIDNSYSQTHAIVVADINGDGLPDFVTGKRFWAHNGHDPGSFQPSVLCWYEQTRPAGKPEWTRHMIDAQSGVGLQFEVVDINGDKKLDIVAGQNLYLAPDFKPLKIRTIKTDVNEQVALVEHAAIAITHGGNNGVTEALTAGVPLLVLPFSTDQFAVAADLERVGLGRAADPNAVTETAIRDAVRALLDDHCRSAAAALGSELRRDPGPARARRAMAARWQGLRGS